MGLLAGIQHAAAQGVYYVPAPKAQANLLAGPAYVARLVDARRQRTIIGWVMASGSPLHQPVMFREGLLAALRPFLTRYVPGQPGAVPLVMRLTGLEIAERTDRFSKTALAGLTADFYAPQPDSSYRLVAHFAQAGDATGSHAANVGELLLAAAVQARNQSHWPGAGPSYPAAYVLAAEAHPAEALPVLLPAAQPQPGYYHSLTEFWNNQPAEPGPPIVEARPYQGSEWAGENEVKPYRRNAAGKLALATDVWGFCDGQHFYIRQGQSFCQLQQQGQDFVFYGRIGQDPQFRAATSNRSTAASWAGIAGMALANVAATAADKRVLFTLSLLTGNVSLDQPSLNTSEVTARPTHLFIYRPRSAKGPPVRIRLAAGQPAQELAAGDYLTFEPASDQPVQVYLVPATGPEVSLVVTPTADAPTYLECRPAEATPLRQVKDDAGAEAVTRLVR
ncbi:hypothetical protein GCM10027422_05770 [Hymenobacter arcticus]